MAFPTVGSWFSNAQTISSSNGSAIFVANFTTGSSNVEYAICDTSLTILSGYTQAASGSNIIDVGAYSGSDIKMGFRMIGYPGLGFNPSVVGLNYSLIGGVARTLVLGSDIQLTTTKFDRAYFLPLGSYTQFLEGSFSMDGGTNWTPANANTEIQIASAVQGSEPLFLMRDTLGSVVLDSVNIVIKQDDI